MFDVIHEAHLAVGHGGQNRMMKKRAKKHKESKISINGLMIRSMMFDEMNSRAQVQLIVMQNQPNKNLKWVLVYQDHLKILRKKLIIDYLTYLAYLHIQFNVRWFNPLSAKPIKWSNTLKHKT